MFCSSSNFSSTSTNQVDVPLGFLAFGEVCVEKSKSFEDTSLAVIKENLNS